MTQDELLALMRKSLRLPDLAADARMGSVRGWDSLRHLRLLLDVEQACKIRIPTEQFGSLTSVEAILAYVERKAA
jgi:acyl carrier protein